VVEFLCSQVSAKNDCQLWPYFVSAGIIFNATSSGIVEILKICFQFYPDLVWTYEPIEGYVTQIAIVNRQEKVFNFLCKMPIICKNQITTLEDGYNNTSHRVARFASQVESIPGAAFQMQRELQWFKVCLI
jgi:hypothetical protein